MTLYVGGPKVVTATNILGSQEAVTVTGTTSTIEVTKTLLTVPLIQNHYYYFGCEVYQDNLSCSVDFYWPIAEPVFMSGYKASSVNTWTRIGKVNNRATWSDGNYASRVDNNNSYIAGTIQFRNFILIDLTATYGSGNEPNEIWCNENIPFFVGVAKIPDPSSSSVARKVKKMYVGVNTEISEYEYITETVNITDSNISDYFTVSNDSYYFAGNGSVFTSNNKGVNSSTARTVLTALYNIKNLSFEYSYSSEKKYDKFTLVVAGNTVANSLSGSTTTNTYTLNAMDASQSMSFSYVKDSSQHSNLDQCSFSNMSFQITRRQKKSSVWVNVARRIKKLYVGVAGVARLIFPISGISFYQTLSNFSPSSIYLASASVGNYALFAGGYNKDYNALSRVLSYNDSLVLGSPPSLVGTHVFFVGVTVENIAIFAFGEDNNVNASNIINAYTSSLTRSYTTAATGRWDVGGAVVGNNALFAGGTISTQTYSSSIVNVCSSSLVLSLAESLSVERTNVNGASVGNYALFDSGTNNTNTMDVYDSSLTHSIIDGFTSYRENASSGSVGNFALFAGGSTGNGGTYYDHVDVYDMSLTHTMASPLVGKKAGVKNATIQEFIIFSGGSYVNAVDTVDIYDEYLTHTIGTSLSKTKRNHSMAIAGNYIIVAGGEYGSTAPQTTPDVYIYN